MNDTVTISKKEYDSLVKDSRILGALRAGGVDNWDGYSDSIREYFPELYEEVAEWDDEYLDEDFNFEDDGDA